MIHPCIAIYCDMLYFRDLTISSAGLDSDITHLPTNLFEAAGMFPEDYERKKIMASKGWYQY